MDVSAFVQENKRWLLGCLLGLVVFFIARSVIGSIYDPGAVKRSANRIVTSVPGEVFNRDALSAAQQQAEEIGRARTALVQELGFVQSAAYTLEGQGMAPDEYLGKVGRELKLRIQRSANERDVEVKDGDRGLSWPSPTNVEQIRSILFGLELLDEAVTRLFGAHDTVREERPQAMGLVSLKLWLESRRPQRPGRRRQGELDLGEVFHTERLHFEFQSDAATAVLFLEALRRPARTLTIDDVLSIAKPQRRGDPVTVKGVLAGLSFVEGD